MPRNMRRLAVAFSLSTLLLAALAPAAFAQAKTYAWTNSLSNTSVKYGFIYPSDANPSPMIYISNVTFNLGNVNSLYATVKSVTWKYTVGTSSEHLELVYTKGWDNVYPPHQREIDWNATMLPGHTYSFTQTLNLNMYWSGGYLRFVDDVISDCCIPADQSELDIYYKPGVN